jgi:hypothetical protein
MKVRLLYPDGDASLQPRLPSSLNAIVEDDLELPTLYAAMADGDRYLFDVAEQVIPLGSTDSVVIEYRQNVLADWMANPEVLRRLYAIAVDATQVKRKLFLGGLVSHRPEVMLSNSVQMLEFLAANLKELRGMCDEHTNKFESDGVQQFIRMVDDELSDEYLELLDAYFAELRLPRGVLSSAQLGQGNKGRQYVLHNTPRLSWWDRLIGNHDRTLDFDVHPRDEAGARALGALAGQAINDVAHTVTESAEHVKGFFARLRIELGFYLGCVNLAEWLATFGVPICFPTATPAIPPQLMCRDLRDVGLCLTTTQSVTGNDVDAMNISLILATGANEGGKSTFLRSVGTAQIMMQAGMFVTAEAFRANVANGVFTHFKREEDNTMSHGKFVEELVRMSEIVDNIGANALLLCNESFASTNEREGSQIALGVLDILAEAQIKVVYVTHLYELAHSLHLRHCPTHLFLRAQRRDDAVRTFRLLPGEPEPTSYGADSFNRVFGACVGADADVVSTYAATTPDENHLNTMIPPRSSDADNNYPRRRVG